MENKNWLSQAGHSDFTDADFLDFGVTREQLGTSELNRVMLDRVHAMNVEGYIGQGFSEKEAKFKADKRRSMAIKGAKINGLTM